MGRCCAAAQICLQRGVTPVPAAAGLSQWCPAVEGLPMTLLLNKECCWKWKLLAIAASATIVL